MKKIFNENGFLSEDGKDLISPFKMALEKITSLSEVNNMSVSKLRVLGSVLAKELGDYVSKTIQNKSELILKLESMTNDQFEEYLQTKYGSMWRMVSLTPEEFNRLPRLTHNQIEGLLKEGLKRVTQLPIHGVRFK